MTQQRDKHRPRVLLTFTGFHDPFSAGPVEGTEQEGPILSLIRAHPVDNVILFSTPNTSELSRTTEQAIHERHPKISVQVRDLRIEDPTDYLRILTELRAHFDALSKTLGKVSYFVATASGTPQMHASWVLLVASGEIPARLLHVRPHRFVSENNPVVTEVNLSLPEFPTIRSRSFTRLDLQDLELQDPKELIARLGIIGDHPAIARALEAASSFARFEVPVLILGESGTGKEKVASLIHQLSDRALKPFVAVNCAAIPDHLAESTLFGHRKGAFTGATTDLQGKFQAADGGTLFLDEVAELSPEVQAKMLRALEDGTIEPVGSPRSLRVNVRLIAATNCNLETAVADGKFRNDLYQRLHVGEVRLPPLRERRSDIGKLAIHFLDEINTRLRKPRRFAPESLVALNSHDWPGNVRELQNTVQRAALLAKAEEIRPEQLELPDQARATDSSRPPEPHDGFSIDSHIKVLRKKLFERALDLSGGNQSEAARLLGVTPQAVSKFLKGQTESDSTQV